MPPTKSTEKRWSMRRVSQIFTLQWWGNNVSRAISWVQTRGKPSPVSTYASVNGRVMSQSIETRASSGIPKSPVSVGQQQVKRGDLPVRLNSSLKPILWGQEQNWVQQHVTVAVDLTEEEKQQKSRDWFNFATNVVALNRPIKPGTLTIEEQSQREQQAKQCIECLQTQQLQPEEMLKAVLTLDQSSDHILRRTWIQMFYEQWAQEARHQTGGAYDHPGRDSAIRQWSQDCDGINNPVVVFLLKVQENPALSARLGLSFLQDQPKVAEWCMDELTQYLRRQVILPSSVQDQVLRAIESNDALRTAALQRAGTPQDVLKSLQMSETESSEQYKNWRLLNEQRSVAPAKRSSTIGHTNE